MSRVGRQSSVVYRKCPIISVHRSYATNFYDIKFRESDKFSTGLQWEINVMPFCSFDTLTP